MVIELSGAGVGQELAIIRDQGSDVTTFRSAVYRLGLHLAVATAQHLPSVPSVVQTPMAAATVNVIDGPVVLVPVLRAGLGLLSSFMEVIPTATVGFEGLRRNEHTLQPEEYYAKFPESTGNTTYVILDPMVATGGSLSATIERLSQQPHRSILAACIIAAPEGVRRISEAHPDVLVVTSAIDDHLNDKGFIVPGLGDAGDRLYGTFNSPS
jgi:uracil phosphoribosyltransferase